VKNLKNNKTKIKKANERMQFEFEISERAIKLITQINFKLLGGEGG